MGTAKTTVALRPVMIKVVTSTQSPAMELTDLFSQIGGFLGLFVGASVVTMFEFFEFVSLTIYDKVKTWCQKFDRNIVSIEPWAGAGTSRPHSPSPPPPNKNQK